MVIALCVGAALNIVTGLAGMATNDKILALLIGGVPGVVFAVLGYALRNRMRGFGAGLLVGGCIIALIGGAGGGAVVGWGFF
jgi:uncharacterized membrane protein YdjX (TVP38/TMEM64 family)